MYFLKADDAHYLQTPGDDDVNDKYKDTRGSKKNGQCFHGQPDHHLDLILELAFLFSLVL